MRAAIPSDNRDTAQHAKVPLATAPVGVEALALSDLRPAAIAQRQLQLLANNSERVRQQRAVADRIGASARVVAQREQAHGVVRRIAPASIGSPVVQRVTDLHVQQGPSCWLFVLEAVAKSQGMGTDAMRMIMESYASGDDANRKVREASEEDEPRDIGRRQAALEVTAERLGAMVTSLEAYRDGDGARFNNGNISRKVVERYARANIEGDRSVAYVTFAENGMAPVADVITEYERARDRANQLVQIVQNEEDDVGSLLQTGTSEFNQDADINDVRLTLENVPTPAYMSIRKRFSPTQAELQVGSPVNLTRRRVDTLQATAHAVLLESYDRGSKIVSYKDPNFGNVVFQVRIGQLRAMADAGRVMIRPFISRGENRSRLAEITD